MQFKKVSKFFWALPVVAGVVCCPVRAFISFSNYREDPPEFVSPENGARYTPGSVPPMIEWTEVSSATGYELQVALDSDFSAPFPVFLEDNFWDLSELLDQEIWDGLSLYVFIQVRAIRNNNPLTDWSDPIDFAKTVASAPIILSPVDDARFLPGMPMPVFRWQSKTPVNRYAVEFAADNDFETSFGVFELEMDIIDCNIAGDPEAWDPIIDTYYWRVWGLENGWIPTPPSETHSFSKTVMDPPLPLTPPDKTRYPSLCDSPVFEWETLPHEPGEYHLQFVYGDDPFPAGGSYIRTNAPVFTFESIGITEELWESFYGTLYWRVAGADEFGNHGGFSKSFRLTKISAMNYMAYGDSITGGWGASDFETGYAGYPRQLQRMLRNTHTSQINVFCKQDWSWFSGCHAYTGSANIEQAMEYHGPQYALIMLGIIDIVDPGAPGCDNYDCHTIEHLTRIIDSVRSFHATPCLATLPPVNPDSPRAYLQGYVDDLNVDIRDLAFTENILLAELDQAFFSAPLPLPEYYTYDTVKNQPDWAHFNDLGYLLIAETWYQYL